MGPASSSEAQPVAPTTVSWTAQGWGAEVGASASSTPRVTSETQRNRQTRGKFT